MSGSAAKGGYSISITAVDYATKQITAINKQIQSVTAPVTRLSRAMGKLGDNLGVTRLARSIGAVGSYARDTFKHLSSLLGPLEIIGGAATVAGMYRLVQSFQQMGTQLGFAAQRTGLAVGQLQGFENAGRLAGTSAESVAAGMQTLGDNMVNAVGGRAPEVVQMMYTLGVAFAHVDGSARTSAEVLPELADKIAALKNPTLQARAATALFGGAAESLLPFLRRGSAGIAEYTRAAQHYGLYNDEAVKRANDLRIAQTELALSTEGLTMSIGSELAPVMTPMLHDMAEWIAAHREIIATNIASVVKQIGDAIKGVDWGGVWKSVQNVGKEINAGVEYLGGWKRAAEGVAVFMAGSWLARMMAPFAALARVMLALRLISPASAAIAGVVSLSGDTAQNPEADAAQQAKVAAEQQAYRLAHPEQFVGHESDPNYSPLLDPNNPAHATSFSDSWLGRKLGLGGGGQGPSSPAQQAVGQELANFFQSQHTTSDPNSPLWSRQQAAGMVASLAAESGLQASSLGDNGQAYGIGQWHPDRQAMFQKVIGRPMQGSTVMQQAAFKEWELTHSEAAAGQKIAATKTAHDAGFADSLYYERPGGKEGEAGRRGASAELWVSKLADAVNVTQPSGDPVNVAGGAGSAQAADPGLTVRGSADVRVSLTGAPQGTKVAASTNGNLFGMPQVNVASAMPGVGP